MVRFAAGLTLASVALSAACAAVVGIDDLRIGDCKGGKCDAGVEGDVVAPVDSSAPDSGSDAALPCLGTGGPAMVRVSGETRSFCIDSTEVTFGQYREFLAAKGQDVSGQAPECAWNATHVPIVGGEDDTPARGIDWCDALAFCRWAAKDLCQVGQWNVACSADGTQAYPYGAEHRPTACNTAENDAGGTLPVQAMPECEGGFGGLFDMLGNVAEWYGGPCIPADAGALADAGDAGPENDECWVKGGSFASSGPSIDCSADRRGLLRAQATDDIGFRCCAP